MTRKQTTNSTQHGLKSRWFWAKLWQVVVLSVFFCFSRWRCDTFYGRNRKLESRNTKSRNESWVRNPIQPTPAQQNSTFIGFGWLRLFTPEMSCFMHLRRIWQVQLTLLVRLWQNAASKVPGLGGISKKGAFNFFVGKLYFHHESFFCGWGIVLKNIKECVLGTLTLLLTLRQRGAAFCCGVHNFHRSLFDWMKCGISSDDLFDWKTMNMTIVRDYGIEKAGKCAVLFFCLS